MKKLLSTLVIFLLATIPVFFLTSCATEIDLKEHSKISFEGPNGHASAKIELDEEVLNNLVDGEKVSKYYEKILSSSPLNELFIDEAKKVEFTQLFKVSVENSSNKLKNGDTVTVTVSIDELLEDFGETIESFQDGVGVKFKETSFEFAVEGLEEIDEYNPFEHITVSFNGISDKGTLSIEKDDSREIQKISFVPSKEKSLKNGETITIKSALNCSESDFIDTFGMSFSGETKEFVVEGLGNYISKISDISEEDNKLLDETLQSAFTASTSTWSSNVKVTGIELLGNYLLKSKGGANTDSYSYKNDNLLYYVYKITVETPDETLSYYWYGYYSDVNTDKDGKFASELTKFELPSTSSFFNDEAFKVGNYRYYGYKELDSLYKKQVVAKSVDYNCESTVVE